MVFDPAYPIVRPCRQTVAGPGEGPGQAGDRVRIARCDGGAAQSGKRIIGKNGKQSRPVANASSAIQPSPVALQGFAARFARMSAASSRFRIVRHSSPPGNKRFPRLMLPLHDRAVKLDTQPLFPVDCSLRVRILSKPGRRRPAGSPPCARSWIANAVRSEAASPVGWPCVRAA